MPDFFDRLLSRSVPTAQTSGTLSAAGTVRVRPRLPGPFERIEAVRTEPPLPDEPTPPPAATSHQPPHAIREILREREIRTGHHFVARTAEPSPPRDERPARTPPAALADRRPTAPLPRTAAPLPPGPRESAKGPGTGRSEREAAPTPAAGAQPLATATVTAPTTAPIATAAVQPHAVDAAAARNAARPGISRRQQPTERVVHIHIGRLEVSAAAPGGRDSRNTAAPARHSGRPAPTLALDAFLSREEKRQS